ncbi:MAG: hypothetical protein ACU84Q_19775 [Gammaproteobacteria bacterium]
MTTDLHLVMHGVAIKKHGTAAAIAGIIDRPVELVNAVIESAVAGDRIIDADGKYMLSPAGHMIVASEYSRFCGDLREDQGFVQAYEQFELINAELKQLITDWQTMEVGGKRVNNDHSDKDYDAEIIDRLGDLHERFEPILNRMVSTLARMKVYREKLELALENAEDGKIEWVSAADIESYHTVWFEMHEDLLRVLGRVRDE